MLWALPMTTLLNKVEAPPRYIANDPRPSLIGMTRDALAAAMGKAGVPDRQRRMRPARSGTGSIIAASRNLPG